MADLSEGTYIILNVKSKMAIDVKGASDSSGANVQQWTKTNSDAQIWALTEQSDGWQIICSLTGKSLDVNRADSGQNVRQWNDNNTINQRWVIAPDDKTITYNNKTYNTYVVKAGGNNSFALDVVNGSTSAGANLQIYTVNGNDAQRWIFIPVSSLKTEGVYEIVLADDTSMCIDIAGGSTANKANAQVYSRNGSNAQKFFADVDDETFTTVFRNVSSNRVLDINGGVAKNGANIQQYTSNNTAAQKWLPIQKGTVKIDGQTTPTYNIRAQAGTSFVMDCKGGGKTAKTNIQLYTNNNSIAQRFSFVKTDVLDSKIATPVSLSPSSFTRSGPGSVTVSGLTFSGTDIYYQARYLIRYFTAARATHTDTSWMNVKDDSTSRSGWGDAWDYSVEVTENSNGDLEFPFTKTLTLNNTNHRSAEIYIEYRAFRPAGTGSSSVSGQAYPTHGAVRRVVISVTQTPIVTVNSFKFVEGSNGSKLGIRIATSDTFGSGCEIFRGRILGSDGNPITEWVATTNSMTLSFYIDRALRRIPNDGEVCTLEYQYLSNERSSVVGTTTATFNYGTSAVSLTPQLDSSIDVGDSCSVLISNPLVSKLHCLVEVSDTDGTVMRSAVRISSVSDRALWECLPPLNKDVNLIIMGSSDGNNWSKSTLTCRVNTHNFIWNWAEKNSFDYYENYAIIIINKDAPPSQTRNFTNAVQFNSPMGRVHPVGFSSTAVSSDFSVEGVLVDPNTSYQSAEPLPDKATEEDVLKLVRLAGKGVHPIYRTPYGDWQIVAIEGVDVSKSELNLSTANVKQRAVDE